MLKVRYTKQFKKEYKLAIKRGCDEKLFLEVLTMLINEKELPPKYNDHALKEDEFILELSRTGTHSDLFKK